MSRSIDLFIDSRFDLAEFAERLGCLVNTPLTPAADGQRYVLAEGDAVAYLGRHRFIDDGDLVFSRYAYVLSARVPSGTAVADSRELALLRHIAELFHQRTKVPVLLVHDLQYRDRPVPVPAGRTGPEGDRAAPIPPPPPVSPPGPVADAAPAGAGSSGEE